MISFTKESKLNNDYCSLETRAQLFEMETLSMNRWKMKLENGKNEK